MSVHQGEGTDPSVQLVAYLLINQFPKRLLPRYFVHACIAQILTCMHGGSQWQGLHARQSWYNIHFTTACKHMYALSHLKERAVTIIQCAPWLCIQGCILVAIRHLIYKLSASLDALLQPLGHGVEKCLPSACTRCH
jgi:hypothetical protein